MKRLNKQWLNIPPLPTDELRRKHRDDLRKKIKEKQEMLEQEARNILGPILDKYGYIDEERRGEALAIMVKEYLLGPAYCFDEEIEFDLQHKLELAKLIRVLRRCDEVVITGVIEHPQNDKDRKGQTTKTKICNKNSFLMLDYFLNTLLEYLYRYRGILNDYYREGVISLFRIIKFTEPYTPDELEQIIEYETYRLSKKPVKPMTAKQNIGHSLFFMKARMKSRGVFSADSKGRTREYAFLYDCFVAFKKIPVPEVEMNNSEKYIFVKDCIKTYKNYNKTYKPDSIIRNYIPIQ